MNSDKLKDIKLKIEEKRIERDKYLKIKKRLEYLEKTALVSEYLELKAIENNEIAMQKNEDIISDIFRSNLVYSEDTENIFIYVGTYKIDEYGNEFRVHRFDEVADYEMFKNIESSLTEDEHDLAYRARNSVKGQGAKNYSAYEYNYATAFEALIGYLYLTKQDDRLNEILYMSLKER